MINIPKGERTRFEDILRGKSHLYGLQPKEYLRNVWYHEEAAKLGEYMALSLLDELLPLLPSNESHRKQHRKSFYNKLILFHGSLYLPY
jgi:hypothetical protein